VKLEVHPYYESQSLCCTNDCRHCTRREDRGDLRDRGIQGIGPDRLIRFIQSLTDRGVHDVVLSGNSMEPLLYPAVADVVRTVKDIGLEISVLTNFHWGERLLEVVPRLGTGDLARISLDAATATTYDRVHSPLIRQAFDKTMSNIKALVQERRRVRRARG
jgi:wyosine [tRNA(Phe)-imidazoG37] synthetase (radical SAM superfamily)